MSKRNLVLCGPPGVGKTTLGRLCAQQLGLSFVDTDEVVQQRTGKTPAQLLLSDGEAALRAAEAALVQELTGTSSTVIATGGGVVISAQNRQHLHQLGPCVTLTATAAELLARLGADAGQARPLLAGPEPLQRLQQLLHDRAEAYAAQPFPALDQWPQSDGADPASERPLDRHPQPHHRQPPTRQLQLIYKQRPFINRQCFH